MRLSGIARSLTLAGTLAAVLATGLVASAQNGPPNFVSTTSYVLSAAIAPPAGAKITSFDIGWVDPVRRRYYVASRTGQAVIVVDTTTNKVVGNFTPGFTGFTGNNSTSGPNGVLTTETTLWVGDAPSRVWALDPTTGAPVVPNIPIYTSVGSGGSPNRTDEGCYDPVHKIVGFANNADSPPFITFISTATYSVVSQIVFDGLGGRPNATNGIEQCQFNPRDQNVYVSIPELNGAGNNSAPGGVAVISLATPASPVIITTYVIPQAACSAPQGMAIGPAPQIGLGCGVSASGATNNAIIQDQTGPAPGSVVMAFPGKGGCDMAWYNPGNNKYFTACSNANPGPPALFVTDAGSFAVQRLATGLSSGAHSVASDPVNFNTYVPVSSASTSGLCSSKGAVDANGCILVYAPTTQPVATHDFNGDSKSDIAWRDTSGNAAIWLMNGAATLSAGGLGMVPNSWSLVGQRDFNGDGKADLLWRDTSGNTAIWLMNGITVSSSGAIGTVPTTWSIVGTGDFNGDGKGDLLWRDTSGNVAIWEMNGTTVLNGSFVANAPGQWTIKGTGDFNGDGKSDILWQDSSGNVFIWEMNGTAILNANSSFVANVPGQWTIWGTGDFNGDGKSDILWQDSSGNVFIWEMNGTAILNANSSFVANVPTTFSIALVGDFNGDGMSDLLWRDNLGNTFMWFMNGTAVASTGAVGNIPTSWTVQSVNAE
jgi:hypothetical protein